MDFHCYHKVAPPIQNNIETLVCEKKMDLAFFFKYYSEAEWPLPLMCIDIDFQTDYFYKCKKNFGISLRH